MVRTSYVAISSSAAAGKVAAPRVADQDVDPGGADALEPRQDTLGEARLVPAVAREDHVHVGRRLVEDVAGRRP